jgi:radical SAM superfamily enzyme YgiQ (UPF0313 family)
MSASGASSPAPPASPQQLSSRAQALALGEPGAILLISCYELGHQPLGLASPLGFLERAGLSADTLDIARARLDAKKVERARFIGISVPMHTALRLGAQMIARIRALNPSCHVCFYGLYASLNQAHLFKLGADSVIGGEYEEALVALIEHLDAGREGAPPGVSRKGEPASAPLHRLRFAPPARAALLSLDKYVQIQGEGLEGPAGYVEATRGCLHRCRHCPITPVYDGRFFAVPVDNVLADVRRQVAMGATHITFGDPDFLNGPAHARRVLSRVHAEFPALTFDFTTKVEHILKHEGLFPELAGLGCVFIVSAFESLNDAVLAHLDKGHTRADAVRALSIVRAAGITLRPTWVPFTPWATLDDMLELLAFVEDEELIDCISPVQYSIRLILPPGSALLSLPAMQPFLGPLDEAALTYRWAHPDPRVDHLAQEIGRAVAEAAAEGEGDLATFRRVEKLALEAAGRAAAPRHGERSRSRDAPQKRRRPPRLTEAWYC